MDRRERRPRPKQLLACEAAVVGGMAVGVFAPEIYVQIAGFSFVILICSSGFAC